MGLLTKSLFSKVFFLGVMKMGTTAPSSQESDGALRCDTVIIKVQKFAQLSKVVPGILLIN